MNRNKKTLLAVASGGGHWDELSQLIPAFQDYKVIYACTQPEQAINSGASEVIGISDYNKDRPLAVFMGIFEIWRIVRRSEPNLIISTGAAPGLISLLLGHILGAKTVWIDSIANAEVMSLSGRIAKHFASLTITQWPHLADGREVIYMGELL